MEGPEKSVSRGWRKVRERGRAGSQPRLPVCGGRKDRLGCSSCAKDGKCSQKPATGEDKWNPPVCHPSEATS